MKKSILVGGSVAGLLAVAVLAGATLSGATQNRGGSKPKPTPVAKHATTSTTKAPTTSTNSSSSTTWSTTTTVATPVDALAGVTALSYHGRYIYALDAAGRETRTLVTAYEGRTVIAAQMMRDHHTIWYLTEPSAPSSYTCNDVVRLDLANNHRTVIAHATGFSVAADGNRVALTNVQPDSQCASTTGYGAGVNVVRDVSTGAQSKIIGDYWSLAISPGGHVLAGNQCTDTDGECHIALRTASVPNALGAPVTLRPANDPKLTFRNLVSRPDGLYATVDTQPQSCGCGGRSDRFDRDITVRRLSWSNLDGAGDIVFTVQGPLYLTSIAPSADGLFAVGQSKVGSPFQLYRLGANGAHGIRLVPFRSQPGDGEWTDYTVAPMPAFAN